MSKAAVEALLDIMKGSDAQRKIEALLSIKQSIKRESIETPAVRDLFQSLRLGLMSPNAQVSGQTLTTTHGAFRRLDIQDPALLKAALPTLLSHLIDKFGDSTDKVPLLARDCVAIAWRSSSVDVEGAIKQLAFTHRVARVRENAMRWTEDMALHKNVGFVFRSFTNFLITALEDADGAVREVSKQTIVKLFSTAPPHAKADLRREMSMQNVRKSTVQHILTQLDISDGPSVNLSRSISSLHDEPTARAGKRIVTPGSLADGSIAGSTASTYVGSLPGSDMETLDAAHVHSARDLENESSSMLPCFEGRESERNWLNREKSLNRLRSLLRGNAVRDHHAVLLGCIKILLEGIIKGMTSLRTSLCLVGLQFAKDLFIVLGPGADQFVEQLLATLVKLTGATKKIQAQAANMTINVLLANVSYHSRLLQHLALAIQDKNVAPRSYASTWINVLLEVHGGESRLQIEHSGIDLLDKSVRKGLADANPGVREGMRTTYWKYAAIWPERGSAIMNSLDVTAKRQLEKASPNPTLGADSEVQKVTDKKPAPTTRATIKSIKTERPRIAHALSDSLASTKHPQHITEMETKMETRSGGLSSGPQRQGLGGAVRPVAILNRKPSTVNKQEELLRSSVRSTSNNAGAIIQSNTPSRPESTMTPRRRKPITDQLESEDWRVRVEGVITLACLLADKEPPNTDGQKISLPSRETLAPILRKLMADSQAEVVDHLMAPEVIAEIAKIIEWDAILPRVLLMSEIDESETGHDVKSDCLPAVKAMFEDQAAVQQCLDTLALLKVAGHLGKPVKPTFRFTTAQKRPIIKAVLIWLTELIERHQDLVDRGEMGNPAFFESSEYRMVMNRTTSMMTNIQPSSMNYAPLAVFLKALRRSNEVVFDKNLSTFERPVIIALKKAWGEKPLEEDEAIDEPVADVESVLGSLPVVSIPIAKEDGTALVAPVTASAEPDNCPSTPSLEQAITTSVDDSPVSLHNDKEDVTIVANHTAFAPKTPAGFRQALHLLDSPWSSNSSPLPKSNLRADVNGESPLGEANIDVNENVQEIGDGDVSQARVSGKFSGPDVWFRRQMKKQNSSTPLPRLLADKQEMLDIYSRRLSNDEVDSLLFRKLIKITREHPTILPDAAKTDTSEGKLDIWEAGTYFDHLMHSLLQYLATETRQENTDHKVQAIVLLRTALRSQPQYFAGHECKAIETILNLRSASDSKSLTSGLDELLPELMSAVDAEVGTITILRCLYPYVVEDLPSWKSERLASLQIAIAALSVSVSQLTLQKLSELAQALAQLIVKALNDEYDAPDVDIAETRRTTVNLCMAIYGVVGDTRAVLNLLRDLKPSQQNLLTYYFANKEQEQAM